MIRLIREGSAKYPWILIGIMGVIVITFVVGMGWWGYGEAQTDNVATVGEADVTSDEYRRAYRNVSQIYRDRKQEDVKPEQIQQTALQSLIELKLWGLAARELGVTVTPAELRAEIIKVTAFQRDGKFDPNIYRRILAANRLTPSLFEDLERERLMVDKARIVVIESVALSPGEIAEAEAIVGQTGPAQPDQLPAREIMVQTFLFQKQQRALQAYNEGLKTKFPVEIHHENL